VSWLLAVSEGVAGAEDGGVLRNKGDRV